MSNTPLLQRFDVAQDDEFDDLLLVVYAAANIFPGDFLLKKFGVTRHGGVVFYDYDELCLLTDCNFRRLLGLRGRLPAGAPGAHRQGEILDLVPYSDDCRLYRPGAPLAGLP